MDLKRAQALLVEETRTRMSRLIVPSPVTRQAENLRDLSRSFQALAICKLLVEADAERCREHLTRSGQARRYFLRRSREEGNADDRFLGLSRTQSVFDAVVAGEFALAREIASLSIDEWHADWEYEDDFCYYRFVHRLLLDPGFAGGADAGLLLARFEKSLEEQPSARLALCRAWNTRDAAGFRDAFAALIEDHRAAAEAKRARITEYTAEAMFWPGSFVSVEALAWLRLAAQAHMAPADEWALCPREARDLQGTGEVPDLFDALDVALRQS